MFWWNVGQLAYNVHGLLLCWYFLLSAWQLKPIEKPKYKIYSVAQ
jgi:hypothetical protein